jgi:hypothetical protein
MVVTTAAIACVATPSMAGPAAAHGPTCSDSTLIDVEVHGQHVVSDYITGTHDVTWPPSGQVGEQTRDGGAALPGGAGPRFHFGLGLAPGASFCTGANSAIAATNQQATAHVPDVHDG